MPNWFGYLSAGLSRKVSADKIINGRMSNESRTSLENLRRLRPYLVRHWRKGILGIGLVIFSTLLAFPQPLINRFLVDDVLLGKRLDLLLLAVLLMGGVKLLSMGVDAMQRYYFTRFEQTMILDLQQNLLAHTLRLPKAFFDDQETGYLMSRLSSDVESLRWFFSSNIVYVLSSGFRFLGGVIFLFYLEWRLGVVTLLVLPLLVVSARFFAKHLRILSQHGMEQYASVTQRFEETLASIPLIKAFVTEQQESKRIISSVSASQQIEMEQTTVNSLANLVLNVVPDLGRAVVLVAGAYWIIQSQWTLGSLLAFQSYLGYVYGPALFLANANMQLQGALTALERVSAIFDILPEEKKGAGYAVEHLDGVVRFDNVSFSYSGQEIVLEDISFSVRSAEHVAIVGPSGVGKTTLVSLLLRFYRPSHGEIYFDGKPAGDYELNSLRQRIGYVSQATILLRGSIGENLRYGNTTASQDDIERSAGVAGIHDFIQSLPEGYDTLVGERGVNLSEGQKQRLSIARALVKDPDILIMDEPTSALDLLTERSIFEALPDVVRGKTLFVVAHRLSTIQQADQILLLNGGHLEAIGTHLELMEHNEYYRSIINLRQD